MAFINIHYTGRKKTLRYKDVTLKRSFSDEKVVFSSGDFVKDWYDMKKLFINEWYEKEPILMGSSDCDHFIMDGAPYRSAYLMIPETGDPYLSYNPDDYRGGIEFFVPDGQQWTWKELRAHCGDAKKEKDTIHAE